MPVNTSAQLGHESQTLEAHKAAIFSTLRVSMPGIIQSFDPDAITCTVQPAINGMRQNEQGELVSSQIPLLVDVPVVFPRGGGCTLTFPIKPGDECLLVFADRCIDFWWQNGGTQEPVDPRQHDLSDAFAIPGPMSQAQKISGISTSAAQLRTDDGAAFVELAAAHDITLVTPGKLTASAQGGTEITSPTITLSGDVTINGNASITGTLNTTGEITGGGVTLGSHTHKGVQTGSGNTGEPNK